MTVKPLGDFGQLVIVCLSLVAGLVVASLVGMFVDDMALREFAGSVVGIGLPGLLCVRMLYGRWWPLAPVPDEEKYVVDGEVGALIDVLQTRRSVWNDVFSVLILVFVCQPIVGWASFCGEVMCQKPPFSSLVLPEVKQASIVAMSEILRYDGFMQWLVSIAVVAVVPAVCEELFFRGALLTALRRSSLGSSHFAVLFSSLIFSAVHVDAEGFIARFILGALLGLVYVLTGRLWLSVLFHAVNNLTVVVTLGMAKAPVSEILAQPAENPGMALPIVSVVLTAFEIHTLYFSHGLKNGESAD